jgi:WD40 repeat protein
MDQADGANFDQSQQAGETDPSREKRVAALRQLAQQARVAAPPPTTQSAPATTHGSRRGWLVASMTMLLVVVLAAGGVGAYLLRQTPHATVPAIPAELDIALGDAGYACPSEMAWSPDGSQIAVFTARNVRDACASSDFVLAVFDARTGKKIVELDPDASQNPDLPFTWTSDGKAIAYQQFANGPTVGTAIPELHVLPISGDVGQTYQGPTQSFADPHHYPLFYIWDTHNGTLASAQYTQPSPALTYRWASDGDLTMGQQLPDAASQAYSGSPVAGTADISRWQSGQMWPVLPLQATQSTGQTLQSPPVAEMLQSRTTLWSPDGRFVAFQVPLQTLLPAVPGGAQPATQCQGANFTDWCALPRAPYPDAALAAARAKADAGFTQTYNGHTFPTTWPLVPVSWRPDGKLLATVLPGDGREALAAHITVSLLRTDTAEVATRLNAKHSPSNNSGWTLDVPITWSPSGQQLALIDSDNSRLTIWGGAALPA